MWVRKRIEISPADLLRAVGYCALPHDSRTSLQAIEQVWDGDHALVCLSVRSGFDLLLSSSGWEAGSEVIMSGLTIPDMPRIVSENGFVPVGVDIDLESMGPDPVAIERSITPRSRAIVVAHLLGGLVDLAPLLEIARRHNLMLIEDCAQAYSGDGYQGDSRCDVSMFSFGPIKTNTALAGGILQIRRPELLQSMRDNQSHWSRQSRMTFFRRVLKYGLLKVLSTRPVCGTLYRLMKLRGSSHDALASTLARGFPGPGFFEKIRKRPSAPLLRLLNHKLRAYDGETTGLRKDQGDFLANALPPEIPVLGNSMMRQTWWVFAVLVDEPATLVEQLWEAGFDGTNCCSLHAIFAGDDSVTRRILRHIVFLPVHPRMSRRELSRLAHVVRQSGAAAPAFMREVDADKRSGSKSDDQHALSSTSADESATSTAVNGVARDSGQTELASV